MHMERKFKVGDRVRDKSLGLDGEVVYVDELSGLPYLVVYKKDSICSSNWRRPDHIGLIPPPKFPEPKFNPYDRVRVNIKGFTPFDAEVASWAICGDHYIYTLKLDDGGTLQSTGESVELINPRYKKGDKVWDIREKKDCCF